MLVLSATYTSQLSALVDGDKLCALLDRTIKFLLRSRHISPTLRKDAEILTLIRRKLFEQNPQPQPQPQPQSTQTGSFSNDRWFTHHHPRIYIQIPPNQLIIRFMCFYPILLCFHTFPPTLSLIYISTAFDALFQSMLNTILAWVASRLLHYYFPFYFLGHSSFSLFSFLLSIISLLISLK